MENRVGTEGGENLDDKADIKIQKISDSKSDEPSQPCELVEMWRSGSQDAARVLFGPVRGPFGCVGCVSTQSQVSRRHCPRRCGSVCHGQLLPSHKGRCQSIPQARKRCVRMEHPGDFRSQKTGEGTGTRDSRQTWGGRSRVSFDDLETDLSTNPSATEANELLDEIHSLLNSDHSRLLELLLENKTQREIAEQLGVDERTIRRRIKSIQDIVKGQLASVDDRNGASLDSTIETINLPTSVTDSLYLESSLAVGHSEKSIEQDCSPMVRSSL